MKVRLTSQWFRISHDGLGDATWEDSSGKPRTIVIDTSADRKYDGATTTKDVETTFLESQHAPDPMHGIVLRVTKCMKI